MSCYTIYEFAKLQGFDDVDDYIFGNWEEWPLVEESVVRGYVDEEHYKKSPKYPKKAYLYKLPVEYTPKPNPKEENWWMLEYEPYKRCKENDCYFFYDRHYQAREVLAELEGDLYPMTKWKGEEHEKV